MPPHELRVNELCGVGDAADPLLLLNPDAIRKRELGGVRVQSGSCNSRPLIQVGTRSIKLSVYLTFLNDVVVIDDLLHPLGELRSLVPGGQFAHNGQFILVVRAQINDLHHIVAG